MKVLVDTHALVWSLTDSSRLSRRARDVLRRESVVVSVINLWELILKKHKKGALLQDPLPWWFRHVEQNSVEILPIRRPHLEALDRLPLHHRDPFDRMLIAQAIAERAVLVTKDQAFSVYGLDVIW